MAFCSGQCHRCIGVPKGSVVGAKHYCMYTKAVTGITNRHSIKNNYYVDGAEVNINLKPCD